MKIGILSDSHGRDDRVRAAVGLLEARGAEVLVHCGDVGSTACLEALEASGRPVYAVGGNMDRGLVVPGHGNPLRFSATSLRVPLGDGTCLAVTHGDAPQTMVDLARDPACRYLCVGHSHLARDERIGAVRIINPGALDRACRYTVAVLDTETDRLDLVDVPR